MIQKILSLKEKINYIRKYIFNYYHLKMEGLLVTGGLGFIGSNFINYFATKYPTVQIVCLDKKSYCSNLKNVHPRENVEVVIGDIRNSELISYLLNRYNISHVIHYAAESHVDNSFMNSVNFTENNVLGTHILLETCHRYNKIKKFIHVSTDEVYGEVPFHEETRNENSVMNPSNPYAASKAAAEYIVQSYLQSYKFPIVITRGNNVYGINQYPEKVIPRFICQLIKGEKCTIQNPACVRNFIYIEDVVRGFECVLLNGEIGKIYNIGTNGIQEYTVLQLAQMLIEKIHHTTNYNEHITYIEDRKFNDCRYSITSDNLHSIGWELQWTNFSENIDYMIEWYRNHLQYWEGDV
jgi:UDP-glucose 4,6-dehydratase